MLEAIVKRTMTALYADGCAVWLPDDHGQRLLPAASSGLTPAFIERVQRLLDEHDRGAGGAFLQLKSNRQPLYTRDDRARARGDSDLLAQVLAEEGIVSALRLPLFEPGGDVVGMLALYHRHERAYSDSEVRLAQAFTDQIAAALHNARLAEKERAAQAAAARQLERVNALAAITEQLLTTGELHTVLQVVVDAAVRLCAAGGAAIAFLRPGERKLALGATAGDLSAWFASFPEADVDDARLAETSTGRALAGNAPILVRDYAAQLLTTTTEAQTRTAGVRALIAAPIRKHETLLGMLWVADTKPGSLTEEDTLLVQALADQAALAIEHTRLVQRGQDAAVIEERSRLARDLHDSVTQSVFSLGMMARAAQTQHARGSDRLGGTLERIADLSQDALKEMRALLFELQPTGLAEDGLTPALRKLAEAFRARIELEVCFEGDSPVRLPSEVETAIFRIVQEALANAAKHAQATTVTLTVDERDGRLRVAVQDNGVGFNPDAPVRESADGRRGGMGMRTMHERAAAAGIQLRVRSKPGKGATVLLEAAIPAQARAAV